MAGLWHLCSGKVSLDGEVTALVVADGTFRSCGRLGEEGGGASFKLRDDFRLSETSNAIPTVSWAFVVVVANGACSSKLGPDDVSCFRSRLLGSRLLDRREDLPLSLRWDDFLGEEE